MYMGALGVNILKPIKYENEDFSMTDFEHFTRKYIKNALKNLRVELQMVYCNTPYYERSNKANYILGQIDALESLKNSFNYEFKWGDT